MRLTLLLAVLLGVAPQESPAVKRVVIISVDGLRPDFYLADGWEMPALRSWLKEGACAKGAESVFPSMTYPAHATIVTGVRPAKHGITSNTKLGENGPTPEWYWEAEAIRARTLWQAAKEKGLAVAIVLWPSTVGADVDWRIPERWAAREGEKTADLLAKLSTKGLLAELALSVGMPKGLDAREGMDKFISDCGAYVFKKYRPQLMLMHLGEVDHLSHRDGPDADSVKKAVAETDALLAKFRKAIEDAKLADETLLIVTGDHGFFAVRDAVAPNVLLARAGFIDLEEGRVKAWRALAFASGGAGLVRLKDADAQTARRAREALEKGATLDGRRLFTVLDGKTLVELGYPDDGRIVLEAEEGCTFIGDASGDLVRAARTVKGNHGYLPTRPKMLTGFVAVGAGVKAGAVVERVRLIDIAPTVARVLGLEMKDVEGRVLSELLK